MKKHKASIVYFKPDKDAIYTESFKVDLSKVRLFITIYLLPDNIIPITEVAGTKLDRCFISIYIIVEEDLIIRGIILTKGLKKG